MSLFKPVNLLKWVEENKDQLKPPVGNKVVWRDERDTIIMIVGGPNKRKDYHVNATEEFFYQIEGDIILGIISPATGKPEEIIIREGEIYLLPANVPHSPRRPAGTNGLVVEQKRPAGAKDKNGEYASYGAQTCPDYIEFRGLGHNHADRKAVEMWLSGYITAANAHLSDTNDILGDGSPGAAQLWLDTWCRNNPFNRISTGMDEFVTERYPHRLKVKRE